ncbi:MAG: site-specific DNA-methyltransferase [Methanimicrococcus sp.]|nr:site-specific DNA-methyltransferase [Methanimicrococcus sp.]
MTETKLTGFTPDIAEENIAALKTLFPDVFEEGKIDFDKLKQVLGDYVDDDKERYNFTWNGKGKALRLAQTPSSATLRPCVEESKNWDTTDNLYIEGDNLEVLKLLQKSYYGKVKMIYIDPPYNTGKDFVYKDKFSDTIGNYKEVTGQVGDDGRPNSSNLETSGRFHTDWLNMMYPRLRLARNLLSEDGVVFISIDDNEVDNLKKICNEIFGEDNFVADLTIIVKTEGRRYGYFAKTHEKVLVFCKNIILLNLNEIEIEGKNFSYFDNFGGFNLKELRNQNTRAFNSLNRPNLRYPFYVDLSIADKNGFCQVDVEKLENSIEVYPIETNGLESVWRWGKDTAMNELDHLVARKGTDGVIRIYQKYRKLTETAKTVWFDKKFISIKGTQEVQDILGASIFDFPKPLQLIKTLTEIASNRNDIILDFFSGSATTAHAVMQLNAEDGGNRKFIMVQLPEPTPENSEAHKAGYKNICEIGKERTRRAGEKIKTETGKDELDIGFTVFKLDSSNIRKWQPDTENLKMSLSDFIDNYVEGRTEQDVVYEIILKMGLELTVPVEEYEFNGKKVYSAGFGALMICVDDDITEDVSKGMVELYRKLKPEVWKVVFKDNGFATDSVKTNVRENLKTAGLAEESFTTL